MLLSEQERIDELGRKDYRIIQRKDRFCFGIDAVLLSWFAEVKDGDNCIDLCSGNGIVPLLLDARREESVKAHFTGLEIQEEMVELAKRSVELNRAGENIDMRQGDLKEATAAFGRGKFQVVTCNPPYRKRGSGIVNPADAKAIARHEILCTLSDVVREAAGLLCGGGRFYMVHRPERIAEIFSELEANRLTPYRLRFVHPYADKDATMVLVAAIKGAKKELHTESPVIVYEADQTYTPMIGEIYGDGRH